MSDFNKIIAFQQVMPYLTTKQQEDLANALDMDLQEIERRLIGKNKEDEFVLILLLMEVCKSITGFDEGVSQLLQTATSDLLVELKNGKKFMLEIKHTEKERYSISMGNLQKRIDYAQKYNLELFFAISIKGFWMLFNSNYLQEKKGKIDISDLTKSILDNILGCISYVFPKNLRIKSVYTTGKTTKSTGIEFPPYGKMLSYELYYNNLLVPVSHGGRYFYALKGGVSMSELLFFIIGIMLGGCIGIVTMCLFQINRLRGKDDDK